MSYMELVVINNISSITKPIQPTNETVARTETAIGNPLIEDPQQRREKETEVMFRSKQLFCCSRWISKTRFAGMIVWVIINNNFIASRVIDCLISNNYISKAGWVIKIAVVPTLLSAFFKNSLAKVCSIGFHKKVCSFPLKTPTDPWTTGRATRR